MLKVFQIWQQAPLQAGSYLLLTGPHHFFYEDFFTFWSNNIFKFILYLHCPSPGVTHFSKKLYFLFSQICNILRWNFIVFDGWVSLLYLFHIIIRHLLRNIKWCVRKTYIAIIKKIGDNRCWWGCGKKWALIHSEWECKFVQPLWKTIWRFFKKLKMDLYDPAIPFLGVHPKELKRGVQWDIHTPCLSQHYS